MEPPKLLSIVIPTLNRRAMLEMTLDYLAAEIEGLEARVELVVVNNASDDDTLEFLATRKAHVPARLVSFEERVDIDSSFRRCVDVTTGRYINIFGDDDLPMPGFVRRIIDILDAGRNPAFIYFNRLIGDEALRHVAEIAHPDHGVEVISFEVGKFISEFTHNPGFITSLVFDRHCWSEGEHFYSAGFQGYKFLARIYGGASGRTCMYVGMPSLIQRRGVQSWKREWPRYWLVNMPSLLVALEDAGTTSGAFERWQRKEVTLRRVIIDCVAAKAYDYSVSDRFWVDASRFQCKYRAILIQLVRFLVPRLLARAVYFRRGKYKGNHIR